MAPIHLAAQNSNTSYITRLINLGADLNLSNKNSLLFIAVGMNSYDNVKFLLSKGVVHKLNLCLYLAVSELNYDIIEILLIHQAKPDALHSNWSPFHLAVQEGQITIVQLMLKYLKNVNIMNKVFLNFKKILLLFILQPNIIIPN